MAQTPDQKTTALQGVLAQHPEWTGVDAPKTVTELDRGCQTTIQTTRVQIESVLSELSLTCTQWTAMPVESRVLAAYAFLQRHPDLGRDPRPMVAWIDAALCPVPTAPRDSCPAPSAQAGSAWRLPWWAWLALASVLGLCWWRHESAASR
jgi:hypothetical protein